MAYTTIDKPEDYFNTITYTGDGSANQSMTGVGFKPDFLWIKRRNAAERHVLTNAQYDFSSGAYKWQDSSADNAQFSGGTGVASFDADGYTIKGSDSTWNTSGSTYVAWSWKMNGGTTSTNTDGDIDSTVQVNQAAGQSIVSWSATNTTARSIGHGLGIKPMITIIRNKTRVENWRVHASSFSATGASTLDNTSLHNTATNTFTADSTSTVFKVGTDFSVNGNYPYIAYCFAPIKGYSKFGHIQGNVSSATDGTADDSFVYCGFRPAFVIYKQATDGVADWEMIDTARDTGNPCNHRLFPSTSAGDNTAETPIDILSTGFKMKDNYNGIGSNGTDYIYMAWAEHPFVTSTGVPTTAR